MKKKSLKGFTLIEILIVLTIFSVVALSLYSTFFSGTSVWRRSEDLNRIYQEARWSLDTIANELRNAVILDYSNIYPDFVVFEGGSDKISFLGITDDGIKKISYFLENENSGHVLKRREIAFIDSLLGLESEKSTEVFSDLACEGGLKFSYAYGSNDSGEDISWQDN
ncbi:MAG: prepilin-type N-terminal cleavage/methylation domain-containing protein, partial [Candidatus Omnitrophica bacterium]|nr:prepilin-type N-terminal cleavage/methylation domain-containing protein [Candidatus Omnitrophota bacterium]